MMIGQLKAPPLSTEEEDYFLTLYFAMSYNGQTHFKNLAAFAARF